MKKKSLMLLPMAALCLGMLASCEDENDNQKDQKEFTDPEGFGKGKIYIVGHKSPDTDAAASAMVYADYLKQLGYDCEAYIAGPLNKETTFILDTFQLTAPEILTNAADKRVILVDHNEYLQAVDGASSATILRVVDNHPQGTVTDALSYDTVRTAGSVCTILYYRFTDKKMTISKKNAQLMLAGILSDTGRLKPAKSNDSDSIAVYNLLDIAGIVNLDAFYTRMHEFADNYDGMTDFEIFKSDYKAYEVKGIKYGIGNVDVTYNEELDLMEARMRTVMQEEMEAEGLDMMFCKLDADTIDCSRILYCGNNAEAKAEEAFLNMGIEDVTSEKVGNYIMVYPHISRKKIMVPQLETILSK